MKLKKVKIKKEKDTVSGIEIEEISESICAECGYEIIFPHRVVNVSGELHCHYCAAKCEKCGEGHLRKNLSRIRVLGELEDWSVCDDCLQSLRRCDSCGVLIDENQNAHSYDGEMYCDSCFDSHFGYCHACGEVFPKDSMSLGHGDLYCSQCFSERFFICERCGGSVALEDARELDDCFYCESCYREETDKCIHSYNYVPTFNFRSAPEEKDPEKILFFGFELELENKKKDYLTEKGAEAVADRGFLYCKNDGSLSDGFEVVSHPFSWNWLNVPGNRSRFNGIWGLPKMGFRSYDTSTCGIHVHMSVTAFSNFHLYKFLNFIYRNSDFIGDISQRKDMDSLERYARLEYLEPSQITQVAKNKRDPFGERYVAANMTHKDTVELRFFRGTLNEKSFWKNIEFCKALYDFTKSDKFSIREYREEDNRHLVHEFLKFVWLRRKEFSNLNEFLMESGIFPAKVIEELRKKKAKKKPNFETDLQQLEC